MRGRRRESRDKRSEPAGIAPYDATPKVVDGRLEFPLSMHLPDKRVLCPKCGCAPVITGKKLPSGETVFKCNGCHIEFAQYHKKGYCKHKKRNIVPADCKKCTFFSMYFLKRVACPYFVHMDDLKMLPKDSGWQRG